MTPKQPDEKKLPREQNFVPRREPPQVTETASASTIVPSIGGHPTATTACFYHAAIIILSSAAAAIIGMCRPISHVGSADSTPNTLDGRIRSIDEEARHPHGPAGDSRLLLRRLRSVQDDRACI